LEKTAKYVIQALAVASLLSTVVVSLRTTQPLETRRDSAGHKGGELTSPGGDSGSGNLGLINRG